MKKFIWSFFAFALFGMLTITSCGDGGAAEKAAAKAKQEKMTADSLAAAAAAQKANFEAETKGAITRLETQMKELQGKLEGADEAATTEINAKLAELEKMAAALKTNLAGKAGGAMKKVGEKVKEAAEQ